MKWMDGWMRYPHSGCGHGHVTVFSTSVTLSVEWVKLGTSNVASTIQPVMNCSLRSQTRQD